MAICSCKSVICPLLGFRLAKRLNDMTKALLFEANNQRAVIFVFRLIFHVNTHAVLTLLVFEFYFFMCARVPS